MGLKEAREDAGLDFKSKPTATQPKIMDFRASQGLAQGLKRVGGRGGVSRLGRTARENMGKARRGKPIILHKY